MSDADALLVIVYIVVGAVWSALTALVALDKDALAEDRTEAARYFFAAPLWPLPVALWLTRAAGRALGTIARAAIGNLPDPLDVDDVNTDHR